MGSCFLPNVCIFLSQVFFFPAKFDTKSPQLCVGTSTSDTIGQYLLCRIWKNRADRFTDSLGKGALHSSSQAWWENKTKTPQSHTFGGLLTALVQIFVIYADICAIHAEIGAIHAESVAIYRPRRSAKDIVVYLRSSFFLFSGALTVSWERTCRFPGESGSVWLHICQQVF